MDDMDEQGLLSLSLAIVTDSSLDIKRKRKRMSWEASYKNCYEEKEGKIFSLLQMRDQMLKVNVNKKEVVVQKEEGSDGLQLIHTLLIAATAVDENNVDTAAEKLTELYGSVSLTGDSVQRVVAYFADGLAARLLTRKSPFYDTLMKEPTPEEELLGFTDLYRASPFYQFAHFTANQAIIEAFEKDQGENSTNHHRALHVIDFDVLYGFQWPSLIQSLSEKAISGSNQISLKITGFGNSLEQLQDTEKRLVGFSKGFRNLAFEFQGLLFHDSKLANLKKRKNETIAVNLVFHLNTLNNFSKISETLKSVRNLNPSIVLLVEQEGGSRRSSRSFLSRFMESLHYYAAMFDSLDDCLPLDSSERLSIEKNHFGKEIKNAMNYDKMEYLSCPRYERIEIWKERMESHGFEGIKLSSKSMIQAKLLLKIGRHSCPVQFDGSECGGGGGGGGGFRVLERDDGKAISLGWQYRSLITASAWHCV